MKNISELDIAEVKHQMRSMYKQVGYEGSLQCLFELLKGAEILLEVITEEMDHDGI